MLAVFSMVSITDLVNIKLRMNILIKVIGELGGNKELVKSFGVMEVIMKEHGKMMRKMDQVHLLEAINEYTSEVGRIIKLTATENSLGLMAKTTKESTKPT